MSFSDIEARKISWRNITAKGCMVSYNVSGFEYFMGLKLFWFLIFYGIETYLKNVILQLTISLSRGSPLVYLLLMFMINIMFYLFFP